MKYISTRGDQTERPFSAILLEGLAPDGGLYLPTHYPKIDGATLTRWRGLSYAELAFEIPGFSRDMVTTLQGLIVLFSGAMAQVAAPALARLHGWFGPKQTPNPAAGAAHG